MNLTLQDDCLPVFKALACQTRLDIIRLVAEHPCNQRELAGQLGISPAIVSGHVRQLEEAGILTVDKQAGKGNQCTCYIAETDLAVRLSGLAESRVVKYTLPVGLYNKHKAVPSCGLISDRQFIGLMDDPLAFLDAARTEAEMLWFQRGYVEYIVPNTDSHRRVEKLTVSLELGSEHPGSRSDWPSQITFTVNHIKVGSWVSPGNFGDRRGRYSPSWWPVGFSQYGLLKTLRIDGTGSYMDEERISNVAIDDLKLTGSQFYVRVSVEENADPAGGLTIYGKRYGDYDQDIIVTTYYKN